MLRFPQSVNYFWAVDLKSPKCDVKVKSMLYPIRRKIAYKLAMVIVLVVAVVSTISILYFNRINKKNLTESLRISLTNAINFSEHVYARPLWDFNENEIERLNRIVLKNQLIVAVNIYDMDSFMDGTMKDFLSTSTEEKGSQRQDQTPTPQPPQPASSSPEAPSADQISPPSTQPTPLPYRLRKLFTPYTPPPHIDHIKKIMGEVFLNQKAIGHFELFYTEAFINQAVSMANKRMIAAFGVIALLISMATIISVTRINRPIEVLAKLSEQVVRKNTYDITVTKSQRIDEVGILVNAFADMMTQIRLNERERNRLHDELKESLTRFRSLFEILQNAVDNNDYSHRIPHAKKDDELSRALNKVMATLETADRNTQDQNWIKNGQAELSSRIGRERDIEAICSQSLSFIATYVDAKVGTLFLKNSTSNRFDLVASFAYKHRKGLENQFKPGEGLAGQAALEKKTILFTEIPPGYMDVSSSLGHVPPSHVVVLPLIHEADVKGVIELGACAPFSQIHIDLLENLAEILAVAINGALFNEKLALLLAQTQEQAEELRVQQEELRSTNEELEEQAKVLRESEEKLQTQQEELQASNEELEEKTDLLQSQKKEIQKKNEILTQKQKEIEKNAAQLAMETQYKSEFLANMSHELRTPLNSLLILANMLSENTEENLTEDQQESAASIYRSGQTLLYLINNILDLSKIEANRVELTLSTFALNELAAHFQSEFHHMAKDKGLIFSITLDEGLPETLTSDMHRLEQIIRNLIGNAIKFTKKGEISLHFSRPAQPIHIHGTAPQTGLDDAVSTSPPSSIKSHLDETAPSCLRRLDKDNAIAIHVNDTGMGISKKNQHRIFKAFRQVDGSIRREHDGTGLGLAISKKLARLLGGEIVLKSIEGQGSQFSLIIPESLTPPKGDNTDASPTEVPSQDDAPPPSTSPDTPNNGHVRPPDTTKHESLGTTKHKDFHIKDHTERLDATKHKGLHSASADSRSPMHSKTILIIEDDPEFATTLKKFFTQNGYQSVVRHTGEEGIKYVMENPPTAIILDLRLPGIDGWAVMNELKNNPATQHIPVHIMSGYDHRRKGMEQGAVGYLTKPVSVEDLNNALTQIETVLSNEVKQLLVVEDNKELQYSILKLMGTSNIQVTSVGDGKTAIERLKTHSYDCMILDLGLPDISGFELLDTISHDKSIDMLPIIVFTGRDLSTHEAERLEAYASTIVLKNAVSMERLIDETALFLHRVESDIPKAQQRIIRNLREQDSFLKGKTVMVVDDDMRNAFALNKYLKSKGMTVTIAKNGKKALEALQDAPPPDIILMDIMMPVMDGFEAIQQIRKRPAFTNLPIIALTAKAMTTDRDECLRCGANDYLSKPLDTSKLLTLLRVWLYK